MGIKRFSPGGETSRERIVHGEKRPGDEPSWWRTIQRAKRPRLGAKRQSGETSCYPPIKT